VPKRRSLSIAFGLTLALAACGGSDDGGSSDEDASDQAAEAEPTEVREDASPRDLGAHAAPPITAA